MSTPKDITDFSVTTNNEEMAGIQANYWADMYQALSELENDPRFQKVILNGYFKDFAINQTSLLAMDYIKRAGARTEVMERLIAVSSLQDYFMTISDLGAPRSYEDDTEDNSVEE